MTEIVTILISTTAFNLYRDLTVLIRDSFGFYSSRVNEEIRYSTGNFTNKRKQDKIKLINLSNSSSE